MNGRPSIIPQLAAMILLGSGLASDHCSRQPPTGAEPQKASEESAGHLPGNDGTNPSKSEVSFQFIGRVRQVESLGQRELQLWIAEADPHFAATIHVETAKVSEGPFQGGQDCVLAIHSVERSLGPDPIGQRFRFTLEGQRERLQGKPHGIHYQFSRFAAEPITR